jgi:3-oxoadipate enol-lactonase
MPTIDTGKVSLFYRDVGVGEPPILLLHELGGSSASWQPAIPRLAAERRVLAVDLRGAGRSEKPPGPFELADQADDLEDLLRALNAGPVDIVGAALGSLVAALLAMRQPDRVRRLMMCAVAGEMAGTTARYLEQRAARVRQVGMRGVADASLANAFPDTHAAARSAYRAIYLANDPYAYAEMSLALARLCLQPEEWGAIRAPPMVVSGAHDFIWPPDLGRHVADLVPGARFIELSDAGHFPHMQTPDALARLALDFFRTGPRAVTAPPHA